jgi:hypothetical protein
MLSLILKNNYNLTVNFPKSGDYPGHTTVSADNVFKDYDKPLRVQGLQIGLINTHSDEYVIFIHKTNDKDRVEDAARKIGYDYYHV